MNFLLFNSPEWLQVSCRKSRSATLILAAAVVTIGPNLTAAQSRPDHRPPVTTQAAVEIADRIQEALAQHGSVDALAAELSNDHRSDSAEFNARARVALEQGELGQALDALKAELALTPGNPSLLRLTASIEEKLGQTGQAEDALRTALALVVDRADRVDVRLRLALLAFDDGRTSEGVQLLEQAKSDEPAVSVQAGVIAYLFGQYDAAARLIGQSPHDIQPALKLLQGNAALRAGKVADAIAAFEAALGSETDLQDRRYTEERIVATARHAGTLSKLADDWLAQPHLPSDQLLPLASVLRELGRVPELLTLWQQQAGDAQRAAMVLTPRFMNEVIGASQEAGLIEWAEKEARDLLLLEPDNEQALSVVLRMLLNHQKSSDADALLAQRVAASADQPDTLKRLARLARSLGRDDAAVGAARALRALGNGNSVEGILIEASIRLRAGQKDAGISLLHDAASAAKQHPDELREVATAFEAADQDNEAVKLLQSCLKLEQSPDDSTLERLAAILLQQRRYVEAKPILQSLRTMGTSPAVRAQAGQRLLEIATAERSIDALITATRAALDAGKATEADLALLVDAYMRSNRTDAAAELLKSNMLLDRKTTLSRLAVLYLRTGKLADASATLRELVSVDPDNSIGTLERLASVELDRKQPAAAASVIDEIATRIGSNSASFSGLMGGIYDRLNKPDRAAPLYRRALAANPDSADEWLLWATATAKAGKAHLAVGRLLMLCDQAKGENVFSIAVDGLLNLKAPPAALRAARRDAILRASVASHETMLFQVISDLSDELQDGSGIVRALDASVAVNREERPQLLRELMENASSKGLLDEANACGLSMLALDDSFPPQLLLQLGEQLLIAGRVQDASRAFTRAAEVGTDEQVAAQAAELFERYGSPVLALRVLAPVAQRKPNDWSVQQTLARLYELAGQTTEAFETYRATLILADRELAALPTGPIALDAVPPPAPNLSALVNGAIATARSPEQKQKLIDQLQERINRELDAVPANSKPSALFFQWFKELHRAAFALGLGDAIDRSDAAMIDRRPDIKSLIGNALAARLGFGLFSSAERFAEAHDAQAQLPVELRLYPYDAMVPSSTGIDNAVLLLPRLLSLGRTDQARQVLRGIPMVLPNKPFDQLPMLIAAAMTLGEEDLATQWATLWARQVVERHPSATPTSRPASTTGAAGPELQKLVQSVWPVLPAAARAEIARQAVNLSTGSDGSIYTTGNATLALQLAAWTSIDVSDRIGLALKLSPPSKSDYNHVAAAIDLAARIDLLPATDQPEFICRAIEQLPADKRLAFLNQIVAQASGPFDSNTEAALINAARKLPDRQTLVWSNWFIGRSHPAVLVALAEATLRATAPNGPDASDVASRVAAAVALSGQLPQLAERTAIDAVRDLLDGATVAASDDARYRSPPPTNRPTTAPAALRKKLLPGGIVRLTLVRYAVAAMGTAARADLLEALAREDRASDITPARHGWVLAIQAVLFDFAGRRDNAFDALRRAFVIDCSDSDICQAWITRLREDGREAELAKTFDITSPQLARPVFAQVAPAMESLFRGREVPLLPKGVGLSDITPRRTLDFMTPRAVDDRTKLAETLRMYLERLRTNIDGLSPIVEAKAGGLHRTDGTDGYKPLFSDLIQWPGSIDDLLATLSSLPQGRNIADQVISILIAASTDPAVVSELLDRLGTAERSGVFTTNCRMLLERLAVIPGVKLRSALKDEIWNDLLFDPTGDPNARQLSECLRAQDDPHVADLELWVAMRSQVRNTEKIVLASRNTAEASPPPRRFNEQVLAEARNGQMVAYRSRIDQVIIGLEWSQISKPERFELCDALPKNVSDPSRREEIVGVLENAIENAATRWPGDTNLTRSLAALGRWCYEHGEDATAKRLLNEASDLGAAQGVGEHQLWVADLAVLLGQSDRAWTIQRLLLENRCLPAVRIPVLLQHLNETGDGTGAKQLAEIAASYCKEPRLLDQVHLFATSSQATGTGR